MNIRNWFARRKLSSSRSFTESTPPTLEALEQRLLLDATITNIYSAHDDFRFIAGDDIPAVHNEYIADIDVGGGTTVSHVLFKLGGVEEPDNDGSDGWSYEFNMSLLAPDTELEVEVYDGAILLNSGTHHVNMIGLPGWMQGDNVTLSNQTAIYADGYSFDVQVEHFGPDSIQTGFETPSDWKYKVFEGTPFEMTVLDLADLWTGFTGKSIFTLESSPDGTNVHADDYAFGLKAEILGKGIYDEQFEFDFHGEYPFHPLPGVTGGIEVDITLAPDFSPSDLTLTGVAGTATVTPSLHADITIFKASIPLISIAPGLVNLDADVVIGFDFTAPTSVKLGVSADGFAIEQFSTHPDLKIKLEGTADINVLLGACTGGVTLGGELNQKLNLQYVNGSPTTWTAPGDLRFFGNAHYTTLWGFGPSDEFELFSFSVANWDFLDANPESPGNGTGPDAKSRVLTNPRVAQLGDGSWEFLVDFDSATGWVPQGDQGATLLADRNDDGKYDLRAPLSLQSGIAADGTYECTISKLPAGQNHYAFAFGDQFDDGEYYFSELPEPINSEGARSSVVEVIDCSGSMGGQKLPDAKAAGKLFVDLMGIGDEIGVVSYHTTAAHVFSLAEITDSNIKTQAKAAIDSISLGGWTSIGAGIQYADNQLDNDAQNPNRAMIVMTDGDENESPWAMNVVNSQVDDDITIFTVGFGSGAEDILLRQIASSRNGEYYFAPSGQDLQKIYTNLLGLATGRQQVADLDSVINPGETQYYNVYVDAATSQVTFGVNWGGSDLDLVLIAPDGTVITHDTADTDPDVELTEEPTYEFFNINNPMPGEWQVQVLGVDVPSGGEGFNMYSMLDSAITAEARTDKDTYQTGELINVQVELSEGIPILGATIITDILLPSGTLHDWPMVLHDDGAHNDGSADDGIYANDFRITPWTGEYGFQISATGTNSAGLEFTRSVSTSAVVTQGPDGDGDGMPDAWEDREGTDKNVNDAVLDNDNDVLSNLEEYNLGTMPLNSDTDGDGMWDGFEVEYQWDPLTPDDPSSLSGYAYVDLNGSGQMDVGETGIAGVAITLSGVNDLGNPVSLTLQTDAYGAYAFMYLHPGTYTITETQPADYFDGDDAAGSLGGVVGNDVISDIAVAAGQDGTGYNFGELLLHSSLSGHVYVDFDNDGEIDSSERGISGVTVALTGTDYHDDDVNLSQETGADGIYLFADLNPGTYTISETQPAGCADGKDTLGTAGGTTGNDLFSDINLEGDVDGINYNFGELHHQMILVGSLFFRDRSGDQVVVTYRGPGQSVIHFDGCTANGSDIRWVQITGARSKSTFEVDVRNFGGVSGDTPVGKVDISGTGFRKLDIHDLKDKIDIDLSGIRRGKKVKKIIVDGKLGDVDASNIRRIDLIQADNIIGKIDAQEIKKLIARDNFDGADVTAAGTRGRIKELRADNIMNSRFSAYKGINKAYIGGTVDDSSFTATGSKGKLNKFYISGDVINSSFEAAGSKGKLGKFYIDGKVKESSFKAIGSKGSLGKFYIGEDVDKEGNGSQFIADRDLKLLDCAGVLNAEINIGRNIKRINAGELAKCSVHAGGTISKAVFRGAIIGDFSANKIKYVRTGDYFKGSLGPKDSWENHFDDPSKVKKVYDKDGRQK